MPQELSNLPLEPLLNQLQQVLNLIHDNKTVQAEQELQKAYATYKALCFECRIVQYPKD